MGNILRNCCRRLCPRSLETGHSTQETERLIPPSSSPLNDFASPAYGSFSQQNVDATPYRPTDVKNRIQHIMQEVENRVIDAGATRYPVLDTQESMDRSKYYSEHVAHTALGPPVIPLVLPRSVGNPVAIITAPMLGYEQRRQIQDLAKANSDAYKKLFALNVDDLVVNFE